MNEPFYITSRTDWSEELIAQAYRECEIIAREELELEVYPNQIEIISAEQMLDAYASVGLPVNYNHWSFGKEFLQNSKAYQSGRQGLAYEIVINSDPCISYLMEENDMVMQTMVIAHAAFGHNAVFKNNECFKQWTNAGSIIDYMMFARDYIRKCEQRYGIEEVEQVLDAAHALAPHGVDKFKRKHRPKMTEELRLKKLIEQEDQRQKDLDIILKKTSTNTAEIDNEDQDDLEEEENLLYFIMKKSPNLDSWKRELLRIVYKINQYFYPQGQTKNLNEGFASFTHYYIMTRLEEKGMLSSDAFLNFLDHHAAVVFQPNYDKHYYNGFNPYAIGFAIFKDIKRICEEPTDEDKEWFPQLIGMRWQDAIKQAAFEHRDDGFIAQYLSPKVIRDFKLFSIGINHENDEQSMGNTTAIVTEIHDDIGYRNIRNSLAQSMERINYVPQIMVVGADMEGDRTLKLKYVPHLGRGLALPDAEICTDYIDFLWGYSVELDG
jgi:spore cortex formation protein SpoVR/YcgB (stage V sporulation)